MQSLISLVWCTFEHHTLTLHWFYIVANLWHSIAAHKLQTILLQTLIFSLIRCMPCDRDMQTGAYKHTTRKQTFKFSRKCKYQDRNVYSVKWVFVTVVIVLVVSEMWVSPSIVLDCIQISMFTFIRWFTKKHGLSLWILIQRSRRNYSYLPRNRTTIN